MKIVIMAGGGGTRLWPLSRNRSPKQFHEIVGDRTMAQQSFQRLRGEFPPRDFYVATRAEYVEALTQQLPEIPADHYLVEPSKRDTAPAMGFACAALSREFGDEAVAFIPSDHMITDTDVFVKALRAAEKIILSEGKMVDIGVVPTFPNTNLGYTRMGGLVENIDGVAVHAFLGHTEKPPLDVAKQYLNDPSYLWHASYYMWTPNHFLESYKMYAPQMYEALMQIRDAFGRKNETEVVARLFATLEKISFDYAITEKMNPDDVRIIPAQFHWSDVGTWTIVKREQEENPEDNVVKGSNVSIDTENCLIYARPGKTIATIGLRNMVIVDTEDALLICPMERDQEVKHIVETLEKDGREDLL